MNVDKIMSWGIEKMKFTDETPLENWAQVLPWPAFS